MLTFVFLGVGGAFAKRNFHSNVLVEAWLKGPADQHEPDDTLLIDLGYSGPMALHRLKDRPGFEYLDVGGRINYPKIKRVFVTHLHADHVGGLEELALCNRFLFARGTAADPFKPQILGASAVLEDLWEHTLKGGLGTVPNGLARLQDYFRVSALRPGDSDDEQLCLLERYRFEMFPTDHVRIERKYDWPSYGLYVTDTRTEQTAFFSGDTRFDLPAYGPMLERARICFHEVQLAEQDHPIHALLGELRTMPDAVRHKTHLYHYSDDWDTPAYDVVGQEFAGFAEPQRRYTIFD